MMTVSGAMTFFFYKGLTRNPECKNTPVLVLPHICRLGWVRNTKFGTNLSNKMLLQNLSNAAKCQGYSLYRFWVNKGKPTGGGSKITRYLTLELSKLRKKDTIFRKAIPSKMCGSYCTSKKTFAIVKSTRVSIVKGFWMEIKRNANVFIMFLVFFAEIMTTNKKYKICSDCQNPHFIDARVVILGLSFSNILD